MSSTHLSLHIEAPRPRIYAALIEADAIAKWKVPDGMTLVVHEFEAREGGKYRVSLTYQEPGAAGKTSAHTDTYHGYFKELVLNERVVEVMEFETSRPEMQGEMRSTIELSDEHAGTRLVALHEGVPPGVAPADNQAGWRMSLGKLARLVEG
ncbi:SRPBCC domain-containing protein [Polaromonas sp. YR568]|uniref:SRPBCC domain-containing protein n=1 Tax=Polaromonas sp. YR568 TaxID=1855301 RepID=UPI00398BEBE4